MGRAQAIMAEPLFIDVTEEFVLNQGWAGDKLRGWRMYRIEYGGFNEHCLFEGRILLPRHANAEAVVQLLMGMAQWEQAWKWHDDGKDLEPTKVQSPFEEALELLRWFVSFKPTHQQALYQTMVDQASRLLDIWLPEEEIDGACTGEDSEEDVRSEEA